MGLAYSQPYDTLSLPHRYSHDVKLEMLDGRQYEGPLIDVNDSTIILLAPDFSDTIEFVSVREIERIKLYRSDFERSATTKLVVLSTGAASFFVALKYYRDRREQLRFQNSEWLLSGMVALISMPLASVISNKIYNIPREKYPINGNPETFRHYKDELKAYAFWTYRLLEKSD